MPLDVGWLQAVGESAYPWRTRISASSMSPICAQSCRMRSNRRADSSSSLGEWMPMAHCCLSARILFAGMHRAPSCAVARVHAPASGSASASHPRLAASPACAQSHAFVELNLAQCGSACLLTHKSALQRCMGVIRLMCSAEEIQQHFNEDMEVHARSGRTMRNTKTLGQRKQERRTPGRPGCTQGLCAAFPGGCPVRSQSTTTSNPKA